MKALLVTLSIVGTLFISNRVFAQKVPDDENSDYQRLKVLEPLIGQYYAQWSNDKGEHDSLMTFAWNGTKRAIIVTRKARHADSKETLAKKPWGDQADRHYYYWNDVEQQIERVGVAPWNANFTVDEVRPKGDGEYKLVFIRANKQADTRPEVTLVATEDALIFKVSNRTDAEGNPIEDKDFEVKRVNFQN